MTERQPGSDPIGELQRWLVRSGARSVTRQLGDQVRTALGGGNTRGDVWESATADHESPDCQWCPICRARRRLRESGPGLSSTVAAAGDAVSVVLQDAAAAFEAAVAAAGRQARPRDQEPPSGGVWDEVTEEPPSGGVWDEVTEEPPSGGVWGEVTDGPARPRPRVVPDPPAGPAEPAAGPSTPSGPAGPAEPGAGPPAPPGPGEANPA